MLYHHPHDPSPLYAGLISGIPQREALRRSNIPFDHPKGCSAHEDKKHSQFARPASLSQATDAEDRTVMVLDALASICISEPSGQAFATSATFTGDARQIIITLAHNGKEVPHAVVALLHNVWDAMVFISEDQVGARVRAGYAFPSYAASFPVLMTKKFHDLTHHLMGIVYRHGWRKLKSRIDKRVVDFTRFCRIWMSTTSGSHDLRVAFYNTQMLIRAIALYLEMKPQEINFQKMIDIMMALRKQLKPLLNENERILETWALECSRELNYRFPLRHYISKCIALHQHALTLCAFSISPGVADTFSRKLVVSCMPPQYPSPRVPLSEDEWKFSVSAAFKQSGLAPLGDQPVEQAIEEEAQLAQTAISETIMETHSTAHPECALLAFHYRQLAERATGVSTASFTPPLNYIGTSKRLCYACDQYFTAYRALPLELRYFSLFHTRDLQISPTIKVDPSWTMPILANPLADAALRGLLYEKFAGEYGAYLVMTGRMKYKF